MATLILNVEYEQGEIVYLRTDNEQLPRIIMGYRVQNMSSTILYDLMCGTLQSCHYELELTRERSLINAL